MTKTRARVSSSPLLHTEGRRREASGVGTRRLQAIDDVGGLLDAANLLAGQLEFGRDVLLRGVGLTGLTDLTAKFEPEFGGPRLDLCEGGAYAADTGHRVGHLLIIAPLVRPP